MNSTVTTRNDIDIIDIEKASAFVGVSKATLRNWVKCGSVRTFKTSKSVFHLDDLVVLKNGIESGVLGKLNGRANKSSSVRTFMPDEYINDSTRLSDVGSILAFIDKNKINVSVSLLLLALNLLQRENILCAISTQDIIRRKEMHFKNHQIDREISVWLSSIRLEEICEEYQYLLTCNLPQQRDVLGLVYQSLLIEGNKTQSGSYYTPEVIVNEIVNDFAKNDSKILDPCCGTGQFLLSFSEVIDTPQNIYGIDNDELAVRIARLNLLVKYKDLNFSPNIICKNFLFEIGNYDLFSVNDEKIKDFDIIATNPPWGIHFSQTDTKRLRKTYPDINSIESFSYFLRKSIDLLGKNGVVSFILPESILNVKTHRDIREVILRNTQIKSVSYLNRVFKNVFTPAIRLDLELVENESAQIRVKKENENYSIAQARWENNQDFVFDIHTNNFDADILQKVYQTKHTTLLGNAEWALGVVTGNNTKHLIDHPEEGFEPIFKGKDIEKFILKDPSNFIRFRPESFQQVAPVEKYRAKEKLVYKFISKNLVFAYDDAQKLTLNSANILIPKIPNYPIKVIAALLNSSLYQFVFQKKFSSIKVLRSHLEQLPLPLWDNKAFDVIISLVEKIIKGHIDSTELDNYIFKQFPLLPEETSYIKEMMK